MTHKPLIILSLALTLLVSFDYLAAWTVPPSNPPSGNIAAPVNTGAVSQIKTGGLGIGSLDVAGASTLRAQANVQYDSPTILFNDNNSSYLGTQRNFWLHVNGSKFHLLGDRDDNGNWSSPDDYQGAWPLEVNLGATPAGDWARFSNQVRANAYCDINGGNCTSASDLGSGSGLPAFAWGVVRNGVLYNGSNVSAVTQSGTAWVVTLASAPTGDTNYIISAQVASNAQAAVNAANPTQFTVQARSSNLNNFLAPSFTFIVWDPN